jgi:Fe-coproporphyrin III synthase
MTWVGGEPMLRKDLLGVGRAHFTHNLVVTNGLLPLPNWPDVQFHVSIDGDEETHERLRNRKGIYRTIMKNASRPDLDVSVAYCISSLNTHCIEAVLDMWRGTGVKGFLFNFYTPIETIEDPLFPGFEKRDEAIRRLIDLKATKYGSFILNEARVLELMLSRSCKKVTDRCLFQSKGISLDAAGNKKAKCMMGDKADCDRCGCIVPFYLHWFSERRRICREIYSDAKKAVLHNDSR